MIYRKVEMTSKSAKQVAIYVCALGLVALLFIAYAQGSVWSVFAQSQGEEPTVAPTVAPTIAPTRPTVPQTIPATATPTITCTPAPSPFYLPLVFRQQRHLLNGGFETGKLAPGWHRAGTLPCDVVAEQRRSWPYSARLGNPDYDWRGGCPTGEAAIYQIIDVFKRGHPTLHYWYRLMSYDTVQFDYFTLRIREWPNGPSEQFLKVGSTTWSPGILWDSGWREGEISLDNYRGRTIEIRFSNAMTNDDGWYNTWTYVDDVRLEKNP